MMLVVQGPTCNAVLITIFSLLLFVISSTSTSPTSIDADGAVDGPSLLQHDGLLQKSKRPDKKKDKCELNQEVQRENDGGTTQCMSFVQSARHRSRILVEDLEETDQKQLNRSGDGTVSRQLAQEEISDQLEKPIFAKGVRPAENPRVASPSVGTHGNVDGSENAITASLLPGAGAPEDHATAPVGRSLLLASNSTRYHSLMRFPSVLAVMVHRTHELHSGVLVGIVCVLAFCTIFAFLLALRMDFKDDPVLNSRGHELRPSQKPDRGVTVASAAVPNPSQRIIATSHGASHGNLDSAQLTRPSVIRPSITPSTTQSLTPHTQTRGPAPRISSVSSVPRHSSDVSLADVPHQYTPQTLCDHLVVPHYHECILIIPIRSIQSGEFQVTDTNGCVVMRVCPRAGNPSLRARPSFSHSFGPGLSQTSLPPVSPQNLRDSTLYGFQLKASQGEVLAQCTPSQTASVPGVQGGIEFQLLSATGEYFARLTRNQNSDRYILQTIAGLQLHFWGSFEHHAINITDEAAKLLATTEACHVDFDPSGRYYKMRVAPLTDIGIILCSLLCIDQLVEMANA